MTRRHILLSVSALALISAACDGARTPSAPSPPSPPPVAQPIPLEQSGPVAIVYAGATPVPGSTISGCGTSIAGCVNRVTMHFLLRARDPGPVLTVRAFLHATNLQACLFADTGPFQLGQDEARPLSLVFDRSDGCGVPLTIATLAVVVEGPVQVASRQTWSLAYTFRP